MASKRKAADTLEAAERKKNARPRTTTPAPSTGPPPISIEAALYRTLLQSGSKPQLAEVLELAAAKAAAETMRRLSDTSTSMPELSSGIFPSSTTRPRDGTTSALPKPRLSRPKIRKPKEGSAPKKPSFDDISEKACFVCEATTSCKWHIEKKDDGSWGLTCSTDYQRRLKARNAEKKSAP